MGNASTTTISYLVLTNIYSTNKQQEILGFLNGVIVTSMTGAPVIGSYLALFFGWRGSFTLLLILSILNMFLCYFFVPNHTPNGSDTISFREYKKIFKSKKTLYYILSVGFAVSPYFIFASLAPILYIDSYGISLQHFGLYQGSLCLVFAIFSFGNGWIIRKFGTKKPVYFSLTCYILYIIYASYILIARINDPIIITSSMFLLSAAVVVPCNILYPLIFEILPESKGKTSAILTTIKMLTLALGVQFASYFYDNTFFTIGISIIVIILLTLFFTLKLLFGQNEISKLH
jgi:DHA1 family bicyclomycin/chloramphenicol resistance-like MFS transporter